MNIYFMYDMIYCVPKYEGPQYDEGEQWTFDIHGSITKFFERRKTPLKFEKKKKFVKHESIKRRVFSTKFLFYMLKYCRNFASKSSFKNVDFFPCKVV